MLTGKVFEGGHTLDAYLVLVATWSYPAFIAVAYFYRQRKPMLVWLPPLTALLFIAEGLVWDLGIRI
jgi:hypothetical protein